MEQVIIHNSYFTQKYELNKVFAAVLLVSNSLGNDFLFSSVLGRPVFTEMDDF